MEEEQKQKDKGNIDGSSLSIGLSLGTAFGIIFDNLALWLPLGVAMACDEEEKEQRQQQ